MYTFPMTFFNNIPDTVTSQSVITGGTEVSYVFQFIVDSNTRMAFVYLENKVDVKYTYSGVNNITSWTTVNVYSATTSSDISKQFAATVGSDGFPHIMLFDSFWTHIYTTDGGTTWPSNNMGVTLATSSTSSIIFLRNDNTFAAVSPPDVAISPDTTGTGTWTGFTGAIVNTGGAAAIAIGSSKIGLIQITGGIATYYLVLNDGASSTDWSTAASSSIDTLTGQPFQSTMAIYNSKITFIANPNNVTNLYVYTADTADGNGTWSGGLIRSDCDGLGTGNLFWAPITVGVNSAGFPILSYCTDRSSPPISLISIKNSATDATGSWTDSFNESGVNGTTNYISAGVGVLNNTTYSLNTDSTSITLYYLI